MKYTKDGVEYEATEADSLDIVLGSDGIRGGVGLAMRSKDGVALFVPLSPRDARDLATRIQTAADAAEGRLH